MMRGRSLIKMSFGENKRDNVGAGNLNGVFPHEIPCKKKKKERSRNGNDLKMNHFLLRLEKFM